MAEIIDLTDEENRLRLSAAASLNNNNNNNNRNNGNNYRFLNSASNNSSQHQQQQQQQMISSQNVRSKPPLRFNQGGNQQLQQSQQMTASDYFMNAYLNRGGPPEPPISAGVLPPMTTPPAPDLLPMPPGLQHHPGGGPLMMSNNKLHPFPPTSSLPNAASLQQFRRQPALVAFHQQQQQQQPQVIDLDDEMDQQEQMQDTAPAASAVPQKPKETFRIQVPENPGIISNDEPETFVVSDNRGGKAIQRPSSSSATTDNNNNNNNGSGGNDNDDDEQCSLQAEAFPEDGPTFPENNSTGEVVTTSQVEEGNESAAVERNRRRKESDRDHDSIASERIGMSRLNIRIFGNGKMSAFTRLVRQLRGEPIVDENEDYDEDKVNEGDEEEDGDSSSPSPSTPLPPQVVVAEEEEEPRKRKRRSLGARMIGGGKAAAAAAAESSSSSSVEREGLKGRLTAAATAAAAGTAKIEGKPLGNLPTLRFDAASMKQPSVSKSSTTGKSSDQATPPAAEDVSSLEISRLEERRKLALKAAIRVPCCQCNTILDAGKQMKINWWDNDKLANAGPPQVDIAKVLLHVIERHAEVEYFACGACDHRERRKQSMKRHVNRMHKAGGAQWIVPEKAEREKIFNEIRSCFPSLIPDLVINGLYKFEAVDTKIQQLFGS